MTVEREDVTVALAVMTTCQGYVQQADGKVSVLMAVQAGAVVSLMTAQRDTAFKLMDAGTILLAIFLLAGAVAGYHLSRALWPSTGPGLAPSLYGIIRIPELPPVGAAAQSAEAWAMARTLAGLAQAKYRHIRRAMPWIAIGLAAGLANVMFA